MFFFLQEFKANRGSRETAPLKLPVDGFALLLPEPEYERHPVRTCRWRYIARQPWLWQQTKTKLHFLLQWYILQSSKSYVRMRFFYLCVNKLDLGQFHLHWAKQNRRMSYQNLFTFKHKKKVCTLYHQIRVFNGSEPAHMNLLHQNWCETFK